jgi:glutathione S-transferase
MERELGTRHFCFGDSFTLADIAAVYALDYLDRVLPDVEWRTSHAALRGLAERLADRESFRKTRPQS